MSSVNRPTADPVLVRLLTSNLHRGLEVKYALTKLANLDIPMALLREYRVEELATKFIMHKEFKELARMLVGKIRRMRKAPMTTITANQSQKAMDTSSKVMVSSKRTAPTMIAPKQKTVSAQHDAPPHKRFIPVITIDDESETRPRYQMLKKMLAQKQEKERAEKRSRILVEVQETYKPEPPTKKKCFRRF